MYSCIYKQLCIIYCPFMIGLFIGFSFESGIQVVLPLGYYYLILFVLFTTVYYKQNNKQEDEMRYLCKLVSKANNI